MKKIFTLLCVTLFALATMANGVEVNGIYYLLDSNKMTASVTYMGTKYSIGNNYMGNIVIPDTIIYEENEYAVTSIGECAFYECTSLTSITIPNSVTTIRKNAFYYCYGLTSVTIPNSVTTLRERAFYKCRGLTSITIPNSVTTIEDEAFSNCDGLTSVTIPNSVITIGDDAFEYCRGLTSVTIGNSVTTIGGGAFFGCASLTKTNYTGTIADWCKIKFNDVSYSSNPIQCSHNFFINDVEVKALVIPEGVDTIGNMAFYDCSGLTSVTIGNSVRTIGNDAFFGCSGLTSVIIPNSVTTIGKYAFNGCTSLPIIDNVRYADTYLVGAAGTTLSAHTIKEGTKWIGDEAFRECRNLTSVTIPNSVTTIGRDAFSGCSGLTSVTIGNSVTTIEYWAFHNCSSLESITCLALVPPFLPKDTIAFADVPRNIPLYVPASSVLAYQAAEQWNEFEINPLLIDIDPIAPDTTQLSWLPVDSASLYKLRIYSEQIELDTTLMIEADSLNGGISIPITLAPNRDRRMPMDDIGSVVVITLEPNSGATKDTPFRVIVSTTSKNKIDILFDMDVQKGEKVFREESGSFTLNDIHAIVTGLEDVPMSRFGVSSGIYDLYGRHYSISQLNQLPAGIYILREGEKASKVMKR